MNPLFLLALSCLPLQDRPQVSVAPTVVDGSPPGIVIENGSPGSTLRVHLVRRPEIWEPSDSGSGRVRVTLHAWADYVVPADGELALDEQRPIAGTAVGEDPLALLRSGFRAGSRALEGVLALPEEELDGPPDTVWIRVEDAGECVAQASFRLVTDDGSLLFQEYRAPGVHGILARPPDDGPFPTVIALHGSEGGSVGKARAFAASFASAGFAALALNYFAYEHEGIEGVPTQHREIALEGVESAREWLAARDGVDEDRIGLYGVSKGAEFALLAAVHFEGFERVVAVVPTDVVWQGYGDDREDEEPFSSWSLDGEPLAFVPVFPYDPTRLGLYRTNTERYDRSRAFHVETVAAARIPVEEIQGRVLLLAGDRDSVWSSGDMSRSVVERMVDAGVGDRVEVCIYPRAGHQIAGTGSFPVRLYGTASDDPLAKDLDAEGAAAADAWRRSCIFLRAED